MPSGIEKTILIATIGGLIMGILGNGFILLVNCIDWVKNQKISSLDGILSSLAIFRISQLWIIVFDLFVIMLWPQLYTIEILAKFISCFWMLTDHLATWFATCLSVFYFFKIANFSHPCFIWLRWRISRVLLGLILGSLFLLFVNLALVDTLNGFWIKVYERYKGNSTWSSDVSRINLYNTIVYSFICLVPFLLSLISLLLLFLSMMRHIRNLQLNFMGSRDLSTEAHKRVMKLVVSFLFLYMVHFSSILLIGWVYQIQWRYQVDFFVASTSIVFPSAHSYTLILGNHKLKQTALRLLWHLKCHLKREKPLAS